ncbi:hypothetical protein BLL37_04655 [Pseudomonas azotoformans]|uniref:Uncharacterized protein n=1 Tax=Pseudomonas azotoformans TaxID=47878 RepID=A0A1V2JT88_PSEAZ|nr:hypothetical protein BLL37_04655 [Pseudomonas azotoformans]
MIYHQTIGIYFYSKCALELSEVSHITLAIFFSSTHHLAVMTRRYNVMRIVCQNDAPHSEHR